MSPKNEQRIVVLEEFLRRYRLFTLELLRTLPPFQALPLAAIEKFLQRQVTKGFLRRHQFAPGEIYYTFGRRAARRLGLPRSATKAFSEQTLPVAAAVVSYCVRYQLQRLTSEEQQTQFPELYSQRLGATPCYIDCRGEQRRFAILLVDRANSLKCLFQKIARRLAQRQRLGGYARWIAARRLQVTILTLSPEKKRQIELAASKIINPAITIRVDVEPTLRKFFRGR